MKKQPQSLIDERMWNALGEVIDPEMYISIVDLGLIYSVTCKEETAHVTMTLTTLGCPLFPVIERDIQTKLRAIDGIEAVVVTVVFDPPWSVERMTEKGKALLGI